MSRRSWVATQLVQLLGVVGCQTVPNSRPSPPPVPSSLTDHDAELALVMAVADRAVQPIWPLGQPITNNTLSDVVAIHVVMVPSYNRGSRSSHMRCSAYRRIVVIPGAALPISPTPWSRPALWSMALRQGQGDYKPLHTPMGGWQERCIPWGNGARTSSATTCQPCSVMVSLPGR
jgi:hypothetical protein